MSLYRPSQWQTQTPQRPQKVIITFPGQQQPTPYSNATGNSITLPNVKTLYAFDVDIQVEHGQEFTRTKHPIQTGGSVSDHVYVEPATLIVDFGMSDGMDAYFNPSTWQGAPSKSVAAYQTLLALGFARIPLTITTRLRTYQNMIIDRLNPADTYKTAYGLRMPVTFGQIFLANIDQPAPRARPQDTNTTPIGAATPQAPSAAQDSQNYVPPGQVTATLAGRPVTLAPPNVVGAGNWSSVNTDNLSSLPAAQ